MSIALKEAKVTTPSHGSHFPIRPHTAQKCSPSTFKSTFKPIQVLLETATVQQHTILA
jgi:hypothetical protein